MSILIKGMEMPKDCVFCPMAHWNKIDRLTGCEVVGGKRYVPETDTDYWESSHRPDWCPLVEVPKHGRLIDGEEVLRAMNTWSKYGYDERNRLVPWNENLVPYVMFEDMVRAVVGMPTIIEAEE